MKLHSVFLLTVTLLPASVFGNGLRAETDEGGDDPLLRDYDPLDIAIDNDPELTIDLDLTSASASNDGHRKLPACPPGCCSCSPKTRVHSQGSFTRGPWCNLFSQHKKSTKYVGGACHAGCKRSSAEVTSANEDKVACGKFNVPFHDAQASKWYSNSPTDCRVIVPYCEHHCSKSSCSWKIYETCN